MLEEDSSTERLLIFPLGDCSQLYVITSSLIIDLPETEEVSNLFLAGLRRDALDMDCCGRHLEGDVWFDVGWIVQRLI